MNVEKSQARDSLAFESSSEEDTIRLGEALADSLVPGTVVALVGTLGAGKTRLVRAIAEAAGVDRRDVNSPTFVLVQEYDGRWPIFHFDTYRLQDVQAFLDLGAEEYLASEGVCLIEWADRVAEVLPADHLRVEIAPTGETSREFRFTAGGERSLAVLERLRASLGKRDAGTS